MSGWIDLNADLGEGEPTDGELLKSVSSCNIACGGHAGDDASMIAVLKLAKAHAVAVGAHPSYPDREGFGRQAMEMGLDKLATSLGQQVETLKTHAQALGLTLAHLKPHGALYNQAARDTALAALLADLITTHLPGASLVGPPMSALAEAAASRGIDYLAEGFADRAYLADGSLMPRTQPGAVLDSDEARVAQALQLATRQCVTGPAGETIALPVQTICLHGDSEGAVSSARAIRAALEAAGLDIRARA